MLGSSPIRMSGYARLAIFNFITLGQQGGISRIVESGKLPTGATVQGYATELYIGGAYEVHWNLFVTAPSGMHATTLYGIWDLILSTFVVRHGQSPVEYTIIQERKEKNTLERWINSLQLGDNIGYKALEAAKCSLGHR